MRAIMVMFDSLRRDLLSCNGGEIQTPNFDRLAKNSIKFEQSYVGSMPCMPARRELHTGRYNFLHRSWGPIEPFDDSIPQILKENGIYTHLTTDHYHYVQDGGATYQGRYSSWECYRGQESDEWIADLTPHQTEFAPNQLSPQQAKGPMKTARSIGSWQNMCNREKIKNECDYPMHQTFDNGLNFIDRNSTYDNWFLQIETFDPHEPFTSPDRLQAKFMSPDNFQDPDWPQYAEVVEDSETVEIMRKKYLSLLTFCDQQLGRVLDKFDEYNLWDDTMLIVNTDHGFMLSEHNWWGKGTMPNYDELVHTPLFVWDPRCGKKNETRKSLVQTIDLAPTLLEFFGVEIPKDVLGKPLRKVIENDTPIRECALFGYHGGAVGISDGRYVLLRAIAETATQAYEYTLMPTHMKKMFTPDELESAELYSKFDFTKKCPLLKIKAKTNPRFLKSQGEGEDLLFDMEKDPKQLNPITNENKKGELLKEMARIFKENEAPVELYDRYFLQK